MNTTEVIEKLGGLTEVARICGVKPPSVFEWRARGLIPVDRCPAIEVASNGEITCDAMYPDIKWQRDPITNAVTGYVVPVPAPVASQSAAA